MRLTWTALAWDEYEVWRGTDPKVTDRIHELIREMKRTPFRGIGKPEPLKGDLSGYWSRRITGDHRMVYRVNGSGEAQALEIVQCRYHYGR